MSGPSPVSDGLFASPAARRSAILRLVGLLGGFVLVCWALLAVFPELTDPQYLRGEIASLGPLAPLAFVALQTVQVVVAPIPGQVLAGVAGVLFGTILGTAYSLLGVTIGSAIAFGLARAFGRPYVESVFRSEVVATWHSFMCRTGAVGLFVLFLVPMFPDDLLCFVAGVSAIRFRTFLVLVLVGRTPSFLLVAYAGTNVANGTYQMAALVLVVLGTVSLLAAYRRERLLELATGLS